MEQSSSFVQHQPFQLYLLHWEFQLDKRPQHDGEKDAGATRRRKKCDEIEIYSDESVFSCSDKFLIREKSDCITKSWDTRSNGETRKQHEKKFKIHRSVEFSCAAARCIFWRLDGHSDGETCTKDESGDVDLSESETWSFQEEEVIGTGCL